MPLAIFIAPSTYYQSGATRRFDFLAGRLDFFELPAERLRGGSIKITDFHIINQDRDCI